MRNILYILFFITGLLKAQPYAFTSAYGGGANATGGRSYTVYHVTNLNSSGAGSFMGVVALAKANGGGTIVFDVSGTINITSSVSIDASNLTIAGQTAPAGGITFTNSAYAFWTIRNCNNVIVRYVRFRNRHTASEVDSFQIENAYNIMVDHVSMSYGTDEAYNATLDSGTLHSITTQRCLIAESKTGAIIGNYPTMNSYDMTMINNLYYNIDHRHPNTGSNARVDILNNVIHNWNGTRTSIAFGTTTELNYMNNYFSAGKRTSLLISGRYQMMQIHSDNATNQIYTAGNIVDKSLFTNPAADNKGLWSIYDAGVQNTLAPAQNFVGSQHTLVGRSFTIKTATESYADVVSDVGCNAYLNADGTVTSSLDTIDTAYIAKMDEGEGAYEDYSAGNLSSASWFSGGGASQTRFDNFSSSVSTTPINTRSGTYDTDNDGMPDVWETATFGNLSRTGTLDFDADGYTDLEEFLNLVDAATPSSNINYNLSDRQKRTSKRIIKNKLIRI
jgi:hypothetical protein